MTMQKGLVKKDCLREFVFLRSSESIEKFSIDYMNAFILQSAICNYATVKWFPPVGMIPLVQTQFRYEWRCPPEFCVLANVNSNDRAALKNAIRRVHKFQVFFSPAGITSMA